MGMNPSTNVRVAAMPQAEKKTEAQIKVFLLLLANRINKRGLELGGDPRAGFGERSDDMSHWAADAAVWIMSQPNSNQDGFSVNSASWDFFSRSLAESTWIRMENTPDHVPELFSQEIERRKARREAEQIQSAMQEGAQSSAGGPSNARAARRV